uniref:Variable large protein n=1 Tax=Borrelia miyamotoi TaxID=47466 RepID=A0A5P8AX23_9SPIR
MKDEVSQNRNYAKVKAVVDEFITGTLDKIASGAKKAASGATGSEAIGGATNSGQDAVAADATSVNSLVKGIKEIVGAVLKEGEGNLEASKTAENEKKSIGKLFGEKSSDGTEQQAAAASASIGAVSGADILRAIAGSGETASEPEIEKAKNAAEIAAAKKEASKEIKNEAQKDAIIAGGIALRGMAKDGKLAAKASEEKSANAVNGAVASAVGKTLSTLIIGIRDTVDSGLKKIKEELGKVKEEDRVEEVGNPAEATARASVKEK